MLISGIALGLFILANCTSGKKSLTFYRDNGNFVISNNYLVKAAMPMESGDIQQLIALDTAYAKLTKGKAIVLNVVTKLQVLHNDNKRFLTTLNDRKFFDNSRYFVDINHGCLETQQLDWSQFGDLKSRVDAILNKYNPATINGNISISNNQIATSVVELQEKDVTSLLNLTVKGFDDVLICPPDGTGKIDRFVRRMGDGVLPGDLDFKIDQVIQNYNVEAIGR